MNSSSAASSEVDEQAPAPKRNRKPRALEPLEPRLGRIDSGLRPFLEPTHEADDPGEVEVVSDAEADDDEETSTKTVIDYKEVDLLAEFGMSRLFHSR